MRSMKAFTPSQGVAEQVVKSRKDDVWAAPQLNFTSRRHAPSTTAWNLELIQEAIGERLIGLVGTVARRAVTKKPGLNKVLVVTRARTFVSEVEQGLVTRLGLTPEKASVALSGLAGELYTWALEEPSAREYFGIEADKATLEVFVRCPNLAPRVESLP